MEKCWFVLKQDHYPPPDLPENGTGIGNGAICLGHIIPDVIHLDNVINRSEEGIMFTEAVPVRHTKSLGLDWKKDQRLKAGVAADAAAPIGAGMLASLKQSFQFAFSRTEKNHKECDTLDRYVIQVDRKFISKILQNGEVAEHLERTKGIRQLGGQWSVFMITGIMVARGAKGEFGGSKTFGATLSTEA